MKNLKTDEGIRRCLAARKEWQNAKRREERAYKKWGKAVFEENLKKERRHKAAAKKEAARG